MSNPLPFCTDSCPFFRQQLLEERGETRIRPFDGKVCPAIAALAFANSFNLVSSDEQFVAARLVFGSGATRADIQPHTDHAVLGGVIDAGQKSISLYIQAAENCAGSVIRQGSDQLALGDVAAIPLDDVYDQLEQAFKVAVNI